MTSIETQPEIITFPLEYSVIQEGLEKRQINLYPYPSDANPQHRKAQANQFLSKRGDEIRKDPFFLAAAIHLYANIGTITHRGSLPDCFVPCLRALHQSQRQIVYTVAVAEWSRLYAKTSEGFVNPEMNPSNARGTYITNASGDVIAMAANIEADSFRTGSPDILLPFMNIVISPLSRSVMEGRTGYSVPELRSMVYWLLNFAESPGQKIEAGYIFTWATIIQAADLNVPMEPVVTNNCN